MHPLIYISLPAILSCGLLSILFFVYRRLPTKSWQLVFSFFSSIAHVVLACIAAILTFSVPISNIACSFGITGYSASIGFVIIDSANLLVWLVVAIQRSENRIVGSSISYILLRLLLHAALILSFWWFAALCTV